MSRNITPKHNVTLDENDRRLRSTDSGKLLFTEYRECLCALLIQNNRLKAARFFPERASRIGAIYIGKIKKIVKNMDACFVEIADKELCFLPLKKAVHPYLLNRPQDGRLLEGDELLVQVERDAQKTKQASVTAHISIANDYFVFTLGTSGLSFSSRLSREQKDVIAQSFIDHAVFPESLSDELSDDKLPALPPIGAMIRTRASEPDSSILMKYFSALAAELYHLLNIAGHRSCFSCLKDAPEAWKTVFDTLAVQNEYQEIITDQKSLYSKLQEYCSGHLPGKLCRLYQDDCLSLSSLYSLNTKLEEALAPRVWLKSGAYIVIQPTEALTVIDVNSGKNDTRKDAEETWRRINREAAEEIALQLRLRNLSGIIIVDFINMTGRRYQQELLDFMRALVKTDRMKTIVVDMTPLGLMEITRKKEMKPLYEQMKACRQSLG